MIEFEDGVMYNAASEPYSYVFVDGRGVGDVGEDVVRERETFRERWCYFVHLVVDEKNKLVGEEVGVQSFGFMLEDEAESIMVEVRKRTVRFLKEDHKANLDLEHAIVKIAKNYIFNEVRRRPRIMVSIHELDM